MQRGRPTRYVALLRGLSLGSHQMPMTDLVALFEGEGCSDVRHYIRSGNIVFGATTALASKIPAAIERAIEADFGFRAPLVLRSADEMAAIAKGHPFDVAEKETKKVHVGFLGQRPTKAQIAQLDPQRSPPDAFVVRGSEIFLHYPGGGGRSKLTNVYIERTLGTLVTLRNWRTVLTLAQMVSEA